MNQAIHRAKIGDVFEVATSGGLSYLQYTHEHPEVSSLIRVLPGRFEERPKNIDSLVAGPTRFVAFYPIRHASRQGLVEWVGAYSVPMRDSMMGPFRQPGRVRDFRTISWEIWDGQRVVRDVPVPLPDDIRSMPGVGVFNHSALIDAIARDWSWSIEHDEYLAEEVESNLQISGRNVVRAERDRG